jgi:hypothetical protein
VTKPHDEFLCFQFAQHIRNRLLFRLVLLDHLHGGFVGTAMQRTPQ